ncbi:eukaryotic translation initiation factor 5 [Ophidiomyces ophidiicola]|uniref:Eukaryotic translation initiation factor 5 n=1 Tax=Ophidiomyces ophidiicola TaxID=1387563 RepID=A0ACB8UZN4_9EURO|nr:eukaryotic translation initiation factor 5 [Ophidiomyces ophidiicola]KAI1913583.1 eukaryotic translation initiation factor 5 [Ophidiomyces ophidiicola]KAI1917302.1 eukaryotic translation initiation factor 5 [Ophidiomyces ophidiicola]KAI1930306.1 eukaryotic translation initiation factor 5 [Ophidiomyces ophidiicola]KAI1944645.1 eukaryotic translation initiation factor 5 [Ophidiomyces ophidiicola]KAI1953274.1 eukaryotic translation initiation factor 5 [Ophidiomyces ophidiicola]
MATVNIRRDVSDPFYRYKMERLQAKIEGKGNGIKTVVVNLNSVAQALGRPPAYLIKYFGFELGAQANPKPTDDRWIINGAHDASKLQDYLDGFISKFVLCKKCKNPETNVVIKEPRILLDCKACGERSEVDARLKLSGFVLKNQPKKGKKDKSTKKTRRERNKEKVENGENGETNGNSPGDSPSEGDENGDVAMEAHSDDEFTRRINAEAKEIEHDDEINDDEWAVDVSEEAVKARAKELPDDLKRSLVFDDEEEGEGENGTTSAYDNLGSWIVAEAEQNKDGASGLGDVEIYMKAKELGIETKHKTLTVLAQTIFDEKIVKQISSRAGMLKKMITSERHMKALLGGTERFVGKEHPELIPQVPAILLAYYQEDLVSEEVLKAWGSKASKKYVDLPTSKKVRKAAEKFLEWLETAESEDESDEE